MTPEDPVHLRLYVGVPAEGSTDGDGKTPESPLPTIQDALERVATAYVNADEPWPGKGNPAKEKSAAIVLLSPVTVNTEEKLITIPASAETTYPPLILSAQEPVKPEDNGVYDAGDITLSDGTGEYVSLLTVGDGVTLTLRNITLKGNGNDNEYNGVSLVKVNKGGNLILADKAVIYGHTHTGSLGGGVCVEDGGTFTMSDGEIWGNDAKWGGGVYVNGGGTFTMSGGVIRGNVADYYGGGVYVNGSGHFAKTGESVIYGNEMGGADPDNTAINGGHAVYVNSSSAKKRDSTAKEHDDLFYNAVDEKIEDSGWDPQS